jgi:hypothetical protein
MVNVKEFSCLTIGLHPFTIRYGSKFPFSPEVRNMRLSDEQIERLAESILADLVGKGRARLKADRRNVQRRIGEIIRGNLAQEQDLDREARDLLETHLKNAPPGMDRQKLFLMIKKKLAEERGIPL